MMRPTILLALASLLPAQRVLLPDGDGRLVQVFDLRKVRPAQTDGPDLVIAREEKAPADPPKADPSDTAGIAELLTRFVEPPLGKGDALQPLGEHFVVLLGSAEQAASIERVFAAVAARRASTIDFELRLLRFDVEQFDQAVKPRVDAVGPAHRGRHEKLLTGAGAGAAAAAIIAGAGETIEAPRLLLKPMTHASMSLAKHVSYIKDFTVTAKDGALIADPMLDTVASGIETNIDATFLPGGLIGFRCDVTVQELEQPIREYSTTLPGTAFPVKIQLPVVRGVRLQHAAVVRDGDVVVLAAKQADGDFVVALVTVREQRP